MFEAYLETKGINPEHFLAMQDNPLAKKFAISSQR